MGTGRPAASPAASPVEATRWPVWDLPVRVLHAALALGVVSTWITGRWWADAHEWLGDAVVSVVALRICWGVAGGRFARFAQFVRRPALTWRYARQVWRGEEPRYLGHNPLGGWMALALLAIAAAASLTGILYTTDWLWGHAWLHDLHAALAWALVGLVPLHLAGVAFTGRRHREPLAAAMVHGLKAAPGPDDVVD